MSFAELQALPTYVINLDRRPDRWRAVEKNLHEFLGADAKIQRVSAVDGRTLDYSMLDLGEQTLPGRFAEVGLATAGAIGCYESHTKVWSSFLESGADYATVLEDDGYFDKNSAKEFEQAMREAKAAEVPYDAALLGILAHRGKREDLGEAAFRAKGRFWGTHGYVMSRKFAKEMLAGAHPARHQIDAYLGEQAAARPDLNILGMRTVVKQGLMGTDVQKNFHDDFSEQVLDHGPAAARSLLEAQMEQKASARRAEKTQTSLAKSLLAPLVALLEKTGALERLSSKGMYDMHGMYDSGGGYDMYGLRHFDLQIYGLFDVLEDEEADDHLVHPFQLYGGLDFGQHRSSSMLEVAGSAASAAVGHLTSKVGQLVGALGAGDGAAAPAAAESPAPQAREDDPREPRERRVQMVVRPEASQEVVASRDDEQKTKVRRQHEVLTED